MVFVVAIKIAYWIKIMKEVYITKAAAFLPNEVVENEEMEQYLGQVNGRPSRSRAIVLRNNGIKKRYYALDKEGNSTHTNAEMAALAVKGLFENDQALQSMDLLCSGTSTPDQVVPSQGVMVHGYLPTSKSIEVVSPAGACCAGMHALKYAYMAVKVGEKSRAVATGSERASAMMTNNKFEEEMQQIEQLQKNPYLAFEKDFLRWMLSDGAGALLLEPEKNKEGLSLRIDWMKGVSYAQELEACMYSGAEKNENGTLRSYKDFSATEQAQHSLMSFKQDVKLLSQHVVPLGIRFAVEQMKAHGNKIEDVSYFLPHMSSYFFEQAIADNFEELGYPMPKEKWFSNLATKGNVGAGSIYLMLEELMNSGRLKKGEQLLLLIPESARFSYVTAWLTVC